MNGNNKKRSAIAAAALAIALIPVFFSSIGSPVTASNNLIITPAYAQGATHCAEVIEGQHTFFSCSTVGPEPSKTRAICDREGEECNPVLSNPTTHKEAGQMTGEIQRECHTGGEVEGLPQVGDVQCSSAPEELELD